MARIDGHPARMRAFRHQVSARKEAAFMFSRKARSAGSNVFPPLMSPGSGLRASPASIDYYVAGLRRGGPLSMAEPSGTSWKAVALVSLLFSAVALIAALVAILTVYDV
jgi:hypothetical protein